MYFKTQERDNDVMFIAQVRRYNSRIIMSDIKRRKIVCAMWLVQLRVQTACFSRNNEQFNVYNVTN